jgi:hypothetical protein
MHYLKIANDRYGKYELIDIVSDGLISLGLDSFQEIDVNPIKNHISIGFTSLDDAKVTRAIAGKTQPSNSMNFNSRDARRFLLELYNVASTDTQNSN